MCCSGAFAIAHLAHGLDAATTIRVGCQVTAIDVKKLVDPCLWKRCLWKCEVIGNSLLESLDFLAGIQAKDAVGGAKPNPTRLIFSSA